MKISELLKHRSRDVLCVEPDTPIEEAAKTMTGNKVGALFVKQGPDNVVGIISERDIVAGVGERLREGLGPFGTDLDCTWKNDAFTCDQAI